MSDEGNDVFSGAVNTQPEMINVQPAGQMYLVEKSKAPQIIGILVIIYYALMQILGILGLFALDLISDIDEEVTGLEPLPMSIILVSLFLSLIPTVMGIFGGYKMYLYEKKGIWIVLSAIVLGWVISTINSALTTDYMGGDAATGAIQQGFCGAFCLGICAVIVCIPLMLANSGME